VAATTVAVVGAGSVCFGARTGAGEHTVGGRKLFEQRTETRWRTEPEMARSTATGSRHFVGENPPSGAQIYYIATRCTPPRER